MMPVSVIDNRLVFDRDQIVTSTQAGKNFGEMRKRARRQPQFVSDRNDGIDTVIVGFDDFEAMAVELETLRRERLYLVAMGRLGSPDRGDTVPLSAAISPDDFERMVQREAECGVPDSELFE